MDYYLWLNESQQGPYSIQNLMHMVILGQITNQTLAWHEGLPDWISVEQALSEQRPVAPIRYSSDKTVEGSSEHAKKETVESFYVWQYQGEHGPFTHVEIKSLWKTNELKASAFIRKEGKTEWVPFGNLRDTFFLASPAASNSLTSHNFSIAGTCLNCGMSKFSATLFTPECNPEYALKPQTNAYHKPSLIIPNKSKPSVVRLTVY